MHRGGRLSPTFFNRIHLPSIEALIKYVGMDLFDASFMISRNIK